MYRVIEISYCKDVMKKFVIPTYRFCNHKSFITLYNTYIHCIYCDVYILKLYIHGYNGIKYKKNNKIHIMKYCCVIKCFIYIFATLSPGSRVDPRVNPRP